MINLAVAQAIIVTLYVFAGLIGLWLIVNTIINNKKLKKLKIKYDNLKQDYTALVNATRTVFDVIQRDINKIKKGVNNENKTTKRNK